MISVIIRKGFKAGWKCPHIQKMTGSTAITLNWLYDVGMHPKLIGTVTTLQENAQWLFRGTRLSFLHQNPFSTKSSRRVLGSSSILYLPSKLDGSPITAINEASDWVNLAHNYYEMWLVGWDGVATLSSQELVLRLFKSSREISAVCAHQES